MSGPGVHEWSLAMADRGRVTTIGIRGHTARCDHPHADTCNECAEVKSVRIVLLGVVNLGLGGPDTFWAFLERANAGGNSWFNLSREMKQYHSACGQLEGAQLIYGCYNPRGRGHRGFVAPAGHSLSELNRLLTHTEYLRRTFQLNLDIMDRRKAAGRGEPIKLPPDMLWGMMRSQEAIVLPLVRRGTPTKGNARIIIAGVRDGTATDRVQFSVLVELGGHTYEGVVWVDDDGSWEKIHIETHDEKFAFHQMLPV